MKSTGQIHDLVNIVFLGIAKNILNDSTSLHAWPEGVACPHCDSPALTKQGFDTTNPERQKYRCSDCNRYFDALTGTIFSGHHQPLRVWILCLYLMGLNLSNRQIAHELGLNKDDTQNMTEQLRSGMVAADIEPSLSGEVECDEVYVVAGPKGHPEAVKKRPLRSSEAVCLSGAMDIARFVIVTASMHVTKTVMAFTKCMSIRSKDFGHCYARGYDPTEGFLKRNCHCIWDFCSSFTMHGYVVKGYSIHYLVRFWLS